MMETEIVTAETNAPDDLKKSSTYNQWGHLHQRLNDWRRIAVKARVTRDWQLWSDMLAAQVGEIIMAVGLTVEERRRCDAFQQSLYNLINECAMSGLKCRVQDDLRRLILNKVKCVHERSAYHALLNDFDKYLSDLCFSYHIMQPSRDDPAHSFVS